ncbi:MAG TPA: ABC transporter permease, partial [Chloroflexia bacterium]
MTAFVLRRVLTIPFTLFGLSILIFALLQLLDPVERAALYVTSPPRDPSALANIIQKYGLDQPIYVQYFNWITQVLQGDLGWSVTSQQPVATAIGMFLPATLELSLWSFIPTIIAGIWIGIQAAVRHNRPFDQLARLLSIVSYSFPSFVFGLLMLMVFYAGLQWFPPGRLSDWADAVVFSAQFNRYTGINSLDALLNGNLPIFLDALRHLFLPALTLGYANLAVILRVTRSSMLDALHQDYTSVAYAKGLSDRYVVNRHAKPNAMIPVATIGGLLFAGLIG